MLILASQSPYRRALLARLGLPFEVAAPQFDEAQPTPDTDPRRLVVGNALGKAVSLLAAHPGRVIIGSDQVVALGSRILTKPGTPEKAVAQLLALAGREHELLTAVAVLRAPPPAPTASAGREGEALDPPSPDDVAGATAVVVNRLRMRAFSREEARTYIAAEQPLDCAGAYKAEGLGISLFESLGGDDPTAIVGLPLIATLRLLRRHGIDPLRPGAHPANANDAGVRNGDPA